MKLSEHFTLDEMTFSEWATRHGVDNIPDQGDEEEILDNLRRTAQMMEEVRSVLGNRPIRITSGYRNKVVNSAVGGTQNSAHSEGLACDFVCPDFGSPFLIAKALECSPIDFDQLIYEYGTWVHIGFKPHGVQVRRMCLTKPDSATPYKPGIMS